MPLLLILVVAAAFTKAIFGHRERMAYARQGLPHPKQATEAAKGGASTAGGGGGTTTSTTTTEGTATTAEGFGKYANTLWNDLWDDAIKRHERERAAREAKHGPGGPTTREQWELDKELFKKWCRWAMNGGQGKAEELPGGEEPKPESAEEEPSPKPVPNDGARFCPRCGEQLIEDVDGWWHRGRQPCPVTGKADPYPGPPPPPPDKTGPPPAPTDSDTTQEIPPQPAPSTPVPPADPSDSGPRTDHDCNVCGGAVASYNNHHIGQANGRCPGLAPAPVEAPEAQRCDRCGEVLVGISLAGHVCPKDPQAREHPTTPVASDPFEADFPAPTDADRERMRVDMMHALGRWCGNPDCKCACNQCKAAAWEVMGGMCRPCFSEHAEKETHLRTHGQNAPTCPRCGSYKTIYAQNYEPRCWVCTQCWGGIAGAAPVHEWDKSGAELDRAAAAAGLPVTPQPDPTGKEEPPVPAPDSINTHNGTHNGGTAMALEFNYDAIVAAHEATLAQLNRRLEQATLVRTHAAAAAQAADGMDIERGELVSATNDLIDGMTEARFDAGSLSGCVDAATAFTSDDAALIEEHCESLVNKATRLISVTNAAIEAVQASLAHIKATYGHLAEGVQSTGVRGEAMEAA